MADIPQLTDERGTTLVELLVGMAMGSIVMVGLTMVVIVTLHGNSRVDARVEATQNARVAVSKIMEDLHSACVAPQVTPVMEHSSGMKLIFMHAASGEAAKPGPIPVKSEIFYSGTTLKQIDRAETGVVNGVYQFEGTPQESTLLSNVGPPAGAETFTYFKFKEGEAGTKLKMPLEKSGAAETIRVQVALVAEPRSNSVHDTQAAATVSDSAVLRLTPPQYDQEAVAPCQ
jgi:Tfp pilus assembly protein PilW